MPIYEFTCGKCGQESELLLRTVDWSGTTCPHCGSPKLRKKLSVFSSQTARGTTELPSCTGDPRGCGRCEAGRCDLD